MSKASLRGPRASHHSKKGDFALLLCVTRDIRVPPIRVSETPSEPTVAPEVSELPRPRKSYKKRGSAQGTLLGGYLEERKANDKREGGLRARREALREAESSGHVDALMALRQHWTARAVQQ